MKIGLGDAGCASFTPGLHPLNLSKQILALAEGSRFYTLLEGSKRGLHLDPVHLKKKQNSWNGFGLQRPGRWENQYFSYQTFCKLIRLHCFWSMLLEGSNLSACIMFPISLAHRCTNGRSGDGECRSSSSPYPSSSPFYWKDLGFTKGIQASPLTIRPTFH